MAPTPVFDLGRVLLEWDPRHLYRTLFADEAEMEHFLAEVVSKPWIESLDRGRDTAEAIAGLVAAHPHYAAEIRAFQTRWDETLPGAIDGTVAILEALRRAGVRTYALTNFAADTFERTRRRFPFLDGFDGIVVSGREGLIKPDPAIFRLLLDRFGLVAAECLFIDDIPANVAAARDVGLQAVRFTDPATLARDLRAAGLPV